MNDIFSISPKILHEGYKVWSWVNYKLPYGYSCLPPLIVFELTFRCNLKCKVCYYYGKKVVPPVLKKDLSTEEIKKILHGIKNDYFLYKPFIIITGGEPFVRNDIFEILEYLKKLKLHFCILTNFSYLDRKSILQLVESSPSMIKVSIDGPEEVHDCIRGVEGSFNKAIANIKLVQKLDKSKKIKFIISCTISAYNLGNLHKIVKLASQLKIPVEFKHLMFLNKKYVKLNNKVTLAMLGEKLSMKSAPAFIKREDLDNLLYDLKKTKDLAKAKKVHLSFLPNIKETEVKPYYSDLDGYSPSTKCTEPWGCLRINPYGDVYPYMGFVFGNLKNESFKSICNNRRARFFRRTLKKIKLFPGCRRCCKV